MQDVAGNKPSRPFLPPIHGDSRIAVETLLWNGSSHALFAPLFETHLKQSILDAVNMFGTQELVIIVEYYLSQNHYFCEI